MDQKKLYLIGLGIGLIIAAIAIIISVRNDSGSAAKTSQEFASWVSVAPENKLFTVKFPSSPQKNSNTFPIPDTDTSVAQELYRAEDEGGTAYFVITSVYPTSPDATNVEATLRAALDGMVQASVDNKLLQSNMSDFKGVPSLEFVIQGSGGQFHQGKILLKDRTLYQIFATYLEGMLKENAYKNFLASFAVQS
jgi:hypothetical protein